MTIDHADTAREQVKQEARKQVFTPEQVIELDWFQKSGVMHPFTCPNDKGHYHRELVPTIYGWICQFCDYTQGWAHDFMSSGEVHAKYCECHTGRKQ